MGSIGVKSNISYEPIKNTPLIFGIAGIRKDTIDIDGYSNKKTEKGALSDLAKAIEKYDKGEADYIRDMISSNEISMVKPDRSIGGSQYLLDWEEVPGASRLVDANGVDTILSNRNDTDENYTTEYKDANYYVHVRFFRK